MVEDDMVPWGDLVVLAAKPNQSEVPWWYFISRLLVYYRCLNAIARLLKLSFRRSEDSVIHSGKYMHGMFLDMYL